MVNDRLNGRGRQAISSAGAAKQRDRARGQGTGMFGFFIRLIGLWITAGGIVALVIDGTRSIALQRLSVTPLYDTWRTLSPASYAAARRFIETQSHPMVWTGMEWTLGLPTFIVLFALGGMLILLGAKRRRNRVRFTV
jgi:hypothetical protein